MSEDKQSDKDVPAPDDVSRALRILERRDLNRGEVRGVMRAAGWLMQQAQAHFADGEDEKANWLRNLSKTMRSCCYPHRPDDAPKEEDWAWDLLWTYAESDGHIETDEPCEG